MAKLTKGKDESIAGVCSGIAKYFNVDTVIVRLIAWTLIFIFGISAVVIYLVLALLLPEHPEIKDDDEDNGTDKREDSQERK